MSNVNAQIFGVALRAVTLLAGWSWMVAAVADDKELAQAIDGARADLASGEWRDALQELTEAAGDAKDTHDEKLGGQYLFFSALAQQQRAEDVKLDAAERKVARAQSISSYEAFLEKNPASGGALNNLAQLYSQDPQQRARALELLDRAVQLEDERVGVYGVNRARLLGEVGQAPQALKWSREAVRRDRNNEAAHALAVDLLRKSGDARGFADYLRELDQAGLVQRALDTGLSEIELRSAGREPILVAMVESLANPAFGDTPDRFLESHTAQRLRKQTDAADIGQGVRELLQLHAKATQPDAFAWWRRDFIEYDELRPGTRAAALLTLARSLGDRCRLAGKDRYPCAEEYYRFAIAFTGTTADPSAFLSLAEIMANSGRGAELAKISEQYERALFRGKISAYNQQNLPKIYEFHLALGVMYGYLGKWIDPQFAPGGAVWQLNRAQETAAKYNANVSEEQRIQLPPQAVTLLSDGYLKTGAVDNSAQVRVEAAEKYIERGEKERAQEVLDPAWRNSLPATVKQSVRQRIDRAATAASEP